MVLFVGCRWFSDVNKLKRSHVKFGENSVELMLPASKTDQMQQGSVAILAAAEEAALCPVRALRIWFQSGKIGPDEKDFAFPSLNNKEKAVTYSAYNDSLRKSLRAADLERIMPHSFRKGSAARALDQGVGAASVKSFGRWRSDTSFDGYIDGAKEWKLAVSKAVVSAKKNV